MQSFLMVIHIVLALVLIGLILLQHGRGADAGAAFGSGASATVFGSRGSGSFLSRLTTILAIAFFANSLALAYLSANAPQTNSTSLMEGAPTPRATGPGVRVDDVWMPPEQVDSDSVTPSESTGTKPADVPSAE